MRRFWGAMNSAVSIQISRRPGAAVAAFSVFLLLCAQANAESPDGSASKVYVSVGGGVLFLDLPESSPFIRTTGAEEAVAFLKHYDASYRAGPLVNLVVGGEYKAFGRRFFTEASGFHSSHSARHVNVHRSPTEPWMDVVTAFMTTHCQGLSREECFSFTPARERGLVHLIETDPHVRSVGWIGAIDGEAVNFGTPNFAWGDPIRITTGRDVEFWGGDVVTGLSFGLKGQRTISLFTGPSFKKLRQASDIFAYESNRDPNVNQLTLKEGLKASYYGGVVGIRFDVPFKARWTFTIDSEWGGYYLDSDYAGRQRTFLSSGDPTVDVFTDLKLSDSDVAMSLRLRSSLSVTCFESLTFQVGAGIEYLSRTPVMRYASLGEGFKSGVRHAPVRMGYSRAFDVLGTFSISYAF